MNIKVDKKDILPQRAVSLSLSSGNNIRVGDQSTLKSLPIHFSRKEPLKNLWQNIEAVQEQFDSNHLKINSISVQFFREFIKFFIQDQPSTVQIKQIHKQIRDFLPMKEEEIDILLNYASEYIRRNLPKSKQTLDVLQQPGLFCSSCNIYCCYLHSSDEI